MPADADTPDSSSTPERSRPTLFRTLLLSLALLAVPVAGVLLGSLAFDADTGRSNLTTAFFIGAILCVAVWVSQPILRAARSRARTRRLSGSQPASAALDDPDLLRAVLAQHDLPCPRCGYNLRGLTDAACPECHEPIRVRLSTRTSTGPSVLLTAIAAAGFMIQSGAYVYNAAVYLIRSYNIDLSYARRFRNFELIWCTFHAIATLLVLVAAIGWWRMGGHERAAAARWRVLRLSVVFFATSGLLYLGWMLWGLLFGR